MSDPDQMQEKNPVDYFKRGGVVDNSPREFLGGLKFEMPPVNKELQELIERVETLENLIKATFDGHVLINGQFRKITL